jgi:flagellar protein FlgJ
MQMPEADAPVAAADPEYAAKVRDAAEKFEGFFIAQLLRQMRESTRAMAGEESVFNSRSAQEMLDMADLALADSLAGQRAFGIADVIVRQLLPQTSPSSLKTSVEPVASSD